MEKLLTVAEAAEQAGVAASTIYRWIQGGVLSLRYFNDGRQAIVRDELGKLVHRGENAALVQLFQQVAQLLGQAVALLPATSRVFGPGWQGHAWDASKWEEIRRMAIEQSEAHRDVGPFVRRRGRPTRVPAYGHGRFPVR